MTTYTDVFGNNTLPPSQYGYQALSISTNTTLVWPYNTSGGTAVSKIIDLTATAGSLILTTPDATQVSTGEDFLIRNVGSYAVTLKDPGGNTIGTVAVGSASYFYLTDNTTTNGTYGVVAYGVGTSTVDAASLVGYGLMASSTTLNVAHPVYDSATTVTIDSTYRAKLFNFTGGTDTLPITSAVTLGDNFFFFVKNSGTGTLTIEASGSETIDGQSLLDVQPGESLIVFCSGVALYSVGMGRAVYYNFTQLVKNVTAAGTFTLTAQEASNKLLTFIGAPAAAVTVIVPNTVAVYYILSSISTAQAITVKTAAGSGVSVGQSQRVIAICDSSDVYSAQSVSASSSVSLVNGSAAAPALNFTSQTNTGLYKYSASGWGFSVNGVASLTHDGTTATLTATNFSISGTITSGTWGGTTIAVNKGGTGTTTLTGLVKGNGTSAFTAAVSGTDYAPATSGSAILKGNGAGGFSSAASGTDYAPATSGSSILYGNGSGGFSNVTVGTGLSFSTGTLSATGGLILLASLTPTAAANVDALSTFTSSYDNYLIMIDGVKPASDDTFVMRLANSGSVDTGSNYCAIGFGTSSTVMLTSLNYLSTAISAGKGISMFVYVMNVNDATNIKSVNCGGAYQMNATPTYGDTSRSLAYVGGAVSGIRFYWATGSNFAATGKIKIFGITN